MDEPRYRVFETSFHSDITFMQAVGRLRYQVWLEEGSIDTTLFPSGIWLDPTDETARHFVAVDSKSDQVFFSF